MSLLAQIEPSWVSPLTMIPAWAVTDEAKAFALGFAFALLVRFMRSMIKNLKRAGTERID
jgi:hypothetical protein